MEFDRNLVYFKRRIMEKFQSCGCICDIVRNCLICSIAGVLNGCQGNETLTNCERLGLSRLNFVELMFSFKEAC